MRDMKAIIDGKRYNTQTARQIAEWDNGVPPTDFNFVEEGLYQTPRGRYFVAGRGGPMSKYCKSVGNCQAGGDDVRPVTEEEAVKWLEDRELVEAIESWFPHYVEDA